MTPLDKIKTGTRLLLEGQAELAALVRELVAREAIMTPEFDRVFEALGIALDIIDTLYHMQSDRMRETDELFGGIMHAIETERRRLRVH